MPPGGPVAGMMTAAEALVPGLAAVLCLALRAFQGEAHAVAGLFLMGCLSGPAAAQAGTAPSAPCGYRYFGGGLLLRGCINSGS